MISGSNKRKGWGALGVLVDLGDRIRSGGGSSMEVIKFKGGGGRVWSGGVLEGEGGGAERLEWGLTKFCLLSLDKVL